MVKVTGPPVAVSVNVPAYDAAPGTWLSVTTAGDSVSVPGVGGGLLVVLLGLGLGLGLRDGLGDEDDVGAGEDGAGEEGSGEVTGTGWVGDGTAGAVGPAPGADLEGEPPGARPVPDGDPAVVVVATGLPCPG